MRDAERERKYEKRLQNIGGFIEALDAPWTTAGNEQVVLTAITIRCPSESRPEALLVLKGCRGEDRFVAFVGALDVGTALLTWRAKAMVGSLKWRVDRPYGS